MTAPAFDLGELEERVAAKFAARAAERVDQWMPDADMFDPGTWLQTLDTAALPADVLQFPREQRITYPLRRTVALMAVEHALDLDQTDEQWARTAFLMMFGGRDRIA